MRLLSWAASDMGRKRDHNEDSYVVAPELHLFAVADGMGGHQGGEYASRLALEVVEREIAKAEGDYRAAARKLLRARPKRRRRQTQPVGGIADDDTLSGDQAALEALDATDDGEGDSGRSAATPAEEPTFDAPTDPALEPVKPVELVMMSAARKAGHAIFDAALSDSTLAGMGTTLSALLFENGKAHFCHAGDSRVYLFRDGRIEQLTEDHSWIWEQMKAGTMTEAEAKISKFRHVITRSVGFERDVDVDTGARVVQAGDCFLLCSDGMSNYIPERELEQILSVSWFRRVPQLLVDVANDRGGDDNITVLCVYIANDTTR
jgi:protein phosphatase